MSHIHSNMAKIDFAQEKWAMKVRAAKDKWLAMVKSARSFEEYVRGIAEFTGLPESTIRSSFPAKNWAEFQRNADKYVELWIQAVERAAREGKWKEGYLRAFGGH